MSHTLEVLARPRLQSLLRELRLSLEGLYGSRLKGLYLFGSYARGDAEPGSDIDVAVILAGEVEPFIEIDRVSERAAALSLDYGTVVSLTFIAAHSFGKQWTPLLANLRREGVAL